MIVFPEVKAAQVLLVNRKGLLGAMIQHVTGYPWTHTALIEGSKFAEEPWTIEAHDLEGVKHCRLQDYADDPTLVALAIYDDPTLSLEDRWAICDAAEAWNGEPYDTADLLGIYLQRKIFRRPEENPLASPGKLICSELVGRAYAARSRNLCPPGIGIDCLAPGDITVTLQPIWTWHKEVSNEVLQKVPGPHTGDDRPGDH